MSELYLVPVYRDHPSFNLLQISSSATLELGKVINQFSKHIGFYTQKTHARALERGWVETIKTKESKFYVFKISFRLTVTAENRCLSVVFIAML